MVHQVVNAEDVPFFHLLEGGDGFMFRRRRSGGDVFSLHQLGWETSGRDGPPLGKVYRRLDVLLMSFGRIRRLPRSRISINRLRSRARWTDETRSSLPVQVNSRVGINPTPTCSVRLGLQWRDLSPPANGHNVDKIAQSGLK